MVGSDGPSWRSDKDPLGVRWSDGGRHACLTFEGPAQQTASGR
jgi:hypothetical protein